MTDEFSFEVNLKQPYEQAIELVTDALKSEGFGILTQIDVKATIKKKLGEDFRPYTILGACNPNLAHQALSADASLGLMLPCNVTVEAGSNGDSIIRIANPDVMLQVGALKNNPTLQVVAKEASIRLKRVASSLAYE
jgi:uncharacterized protein (DUF302 family)